MARSTDRSSPLGRVEPRTRGPDQDLDAAGARDGGDVRGEGERADGETAGGVAATVLAYNLGPTPPAPSQPPPPPLTAAARQALPMTALRKDLTAPPPLSIRPCAQGSVDALVAARLAKKLDFMGQILD
ncbi:hypothetical protein [Streptomyces canus]|uniref:hypothetical protein n=1 Tax=Streptomyces canus TaxID=58343 RepID=UPI001319E949|nr:hypothetical protein [Streptomyces canus]